MSISDSLREHHLSVAPQGVVVESLKDGSRLCFRWQDVARVVAYKLDLWSFDQVRVCVLTTDGAEIDFSEDDGGFRKVMDAAPGALPACPPLLDWHVPITAEPFARSETVLWPPPPET